MTHRLPVRLCLLAIVLVLLGRPAGVAASGIATFRLSNIGSVPVSKVDFNVLPPGAIEPPIVGTDPATGQPITASPVTILTGSTGFDLDTLSVALGSGPGIQGLRLLFGQRQELGPDGTIVFVPINGPKGEPPRFFDPGGQLNFGVNLSPTLVGTLQLVLPASAAGLELKAYAPPTVNPPLANVPEPISLTVWSALAGLGIAGIRASRGARRA